MRQIIESSVWEADPITRVLWVTMLIIGSEPGRRGTVDMTVGSLAGRARLSEEQTLAGLRVLASPDPESRNQGDDGRRIALLDVTGSRTWGWRILNWEAYEAARASAFNAQRQARHRATTKRVQRPKRYAALRSNPEKEKEKEKRERGAALSHRPSDEEIRGFWEAESLRGSPRRFALWHDARADWESMADWRSVARLWSDRERERVADDAAGQPWGTYRPEEADTDG
jgi:hypothetical protein